jgi:hypothetical protein
MKIGLVTYAPEKVDGYEMHVFYSKSVDGRVFPAAKNMQNDATCFCDAKAIREDPSIVSLSKNGPALRKNKNANLSFDFVCPTNPLYRAKLYKYIDELSIQPIEGVTLNLYHFPERGFCTCPRCTELAKKSGLRWIDWRAKTITDFLAEAKTHVKSTFAVEMYPDPLLAKERFGIDFDAIANLVDYFHVPLSSRDYLTNYWVEILAGDFIKLLKKPVVVEISGEMQTPEKTEALLKTVGILSRLDLMGTLLLVHDSENAREIARFAVHNETFRSWLSNSDLPKMERIVSNWAKFY